MLLSDSTMLDKKHEYVSFNFSTSIDCFLWLLNLFLLPTTSCPRIPRRRHSIKPPGTRITLNKASTFKQQNFSLAASLCRVLCLLRGTPLPDMQSCKNIDVSWFHA